MKKMMLSILVITAVGCASKPRHEFAMDAKADVSRELANAEKELVSLKDQQADVLAPKAYSRAEEAIDKAKAFERKDKSDEKILKQALLARGYEADAQMDVDAVQGELQSVLESREQARRAGADRFDSRKFEKADRKLAGLAEDLRKGKNRNLGDRVNALNEMYREAQGRAAVIDKLGQARKTIDTARREGAWKWAPTTLKEAELQYEQSEKAVLGSPGNEQITDPAARRANEVATKLLTVNREAQGLIRVRPELIVLRDMSTNAQYEKERAEREEELAAARGYAEQTNEERLSAEMKAARLGASVSAAEAIAAQERAAAERARQAQANSDEAKAAEIRKIFSKDEADVLTTDSGILIRLRGLQFASNKSVLTPKQYPLLAKVKKALEITNAEEITVAGHTDAVGTKEANHKLSEKRAEAVRLFLIANEAVNADDIVAVGYGYEQPVTSNKTAAGRAANRRIDILIKTE